MTRTTGRLNALKVTRAASKPGMYADGGGLYLQVTPGGASWIYRYMLKGCAREMGLGPLALYGLHDARAKALDARRLRHEGVDPIEARRAARAKERLDTARVMTFKQCADSYIKAHRFEFLKKMFAIMSKNEHSGIVFTLGEEIRATTLKDLPNGDVEIYSRPCIPVPSWDTETWNEAACDPAFQRLSSEVVSCVRDYHVWLPVFAGFVLSRDEFVKWLAKSGFALPTFWSGNVAGGATQSPATRAAKCPSGDFIKDCIAFVT